jgi:hypothetical protein
MVRDAARSPYSVRITPLRVLATVLFDVMFIAYPVFFAGARWGDNRRRQGRHPYKVGPAMPPDSDDL